MYVPIPNRTQLEELGCVILADPTRLQESLEQGEIEGDGFMLARVSLLGAIDRMVEEKTIHKEEARRHYATLGFSTTELVTIRQNAALNTSSDRTGA